MSTRAMGKLLAVVGATLLAACETSGVNAPGPGSASGRLAPAASTAEGQNWNENTRLAFWFTSQGSRIVPYRWFLALEQSGGTALFRDAANLDRLGYVPVGSAPGVLPPIRTMSSVVAVVAPGRTSKPML